MSAVNQEQVIWFDIDDTLILHDHAAHPNLPKVLVHDPYTNARRLVAVHMPHLLVLKERANRGACIILHSAGGGRWAKAVACALDIEQLVYDCLSKPIAIFDDLPIKSAIGRTTYLSPNSKWKAKAYGR